MFRSPRWLAAAAALTLGTAAQAAPPLLVYIGMHGSEIRVGHFDPAKGTLTVDGPVAQVPRPTWTVAHPTLPILYSVNEVGNDGKSNGSVYAFHIDRKTGALTKIGEVDAGGGGTTFLTLDPRSHTLFAANFGGGSVATIPINPDGTLGQRTSLVQDIGTGPHKRQTSPHAHAAEIDPTGHFVLVSDLGADRLFVYPFDAATHTLSLPAKGAEHHYIAPPGSGPRHTVFSPDGHYVYLLNELTADLVSFRWDGARGVPTQIDRRSTNSAGFTGESSVSEIAVSPDGRFLYAGNRGENTLVVYALNRATGKPTLIQRISGGGDTPWSFSFDPGHRWLLVANEHSGKIAVFSVNRATGKLTDTKARVDTPSPVSITFVPGR